MAARLILDANILVRAVLGTRVRALLEGYATEVAFFVPESAVAEAEEYLPALLLKRRLSADRTLEMLERLRDLLQELPLAFYSGRSSA